MKHQRTGQDHTDTQDGASADRTEYIQTGRCIGRRDEWTEHIETMNGQRQTDVSEGEGGKGRGGRRGNMETREQLHSTKIMFNTHTPNDDITQHTTSNIRTALCSNSQVTYMYMYTRESHDHYDITAPPTCGCLNAHVGLHE